ncbi:MAG: Gfo/Idh/MocA family oxidoreductase, partial [Deltaproteobacteria bacterium]|nr:Gfo/Idh/MocA family oxidoreductase [Deltaproteobacteria bacterium]
MQKFKVGIIGLGVGEKQIPAFEGHPSCEVRAICDFSDKRLSAAAAYCPDAKLTNSAAHILDDPGIDIVSIASFDNYHFEQISTAIRNGKHVFVEKPMCLYFQEALMIQRLLGENPGIQLSSNLNLRTCPRFIRLKHLIKCGEMGQIPYLEGDYLWGRVHKLTKGWRKDMEFYSIIHGAAVHMVDLIMWITEKKPAEVHAYGNQMATANSGLRYNDFAVILMKFENG